ncbi:hypothetical protein GGX14DRAFT_562085 [Mycena pura]|uniref:Uncharacterized protein n=1 Tax=Mycena pura TaxID=153505 RepID=A0AAD6VMK9_9AGAR|nr:hypothetical protein GGX14DRAFT_562085 [Mycena pura]
MLTTTSLPSPSLSSHASASYERRHDVPRPPANFYMYVDASEFQHHSRKSADLETGLLVPGAATDAVPDLAAKQTSRRGIYAAYPGRFWFPRGSATQQPTEKATGAAEPSANARYRPSKLEWRLQAGSWIAMLLLLLLTIYFLMREL